MKKFLATAIAAVFMLASCSKDSEDSTPINSVDTNVLLKKSITTRNGETLIANYTYSGKKLQNIQYSNGFQDVYSYDGDMLAKVEELRNEEIYKTETFIYAGITKLKTYNLLFADGQTREIKFNYNDNDNDNKEEITISEGVESGILHINGDNIQSYTIGMLTYTHLYDTKNSPFRNMHANNILAIARKKGGANNLTSYRKSGLGTPEGYTAVYEYNDKNYPIKETQTTLGGETTTIEYFYE